MTEDNILFQSARGTRDLWGRDVTIRQHIIDIFTDVAKRRNAIPLETSVLERMDTVRGLYGEEFNKLVYNVPGEREELIMKYDQTVPAARAVNNIGMESGIVYQTSRVYRRDQPQIAKGRYREFYQADCDIYGVNSQQMVQEYMILDMAIDALERMIYPSRLLNHARLLKFVHKYLI